MRILACVALGFGLTACVEADPSVTFCPDGSTAVVGGCLPLPPWSLDVGTATNTGDRADAGTPQPDFTGRWALEVTILQAVTDPELGREERLVRLLALVDLGGPGIAPQVGLCALRPGTFADIETTYPESAIRASIAWAPTVTAAGNEIVIDDFGYLLGWTTDEPRTAALPVETTDPRVIDGDADENPGVTLTLSGAQTGAVYVASRFQLRLQGRATAPNAILGSNEMEHERAVLNATDGVTFVDPDFEQIGLPNENTFRMLRLAPSGTCADALGTL